MDPIVRCLIIRGRHGVLRTGKQGVIPMKLSIIATAAMAGVLAPALLCASGASAAAALPVMSATFLQPSGTTIPWNGQQYQREITLERAVGITEIVDQWTVDEDANQAYYPDPSGWYPRSAAAIDKASGPTCTSPTRRESEVCKGCRPCACRPQQAHLPTSTSKRRMMVIRRMSSWY